MKSACDVRTSLTVNCSEDTHHNSMDVDNLNIKTSSSGDVALLLLSFTPECHAPVNGCDPGTGVH